MSFPAPLRLLLRPFLIVMAAGLLRADPVITEFLASNNGILADDDGRYSDWIELHNPDSAPVNLAGWYLTDNITTRTKWQFPAVTLPAGGYLIVWASNENRRDPAKPLHTNFVLKAEGEYLALVRPDGVTITSEFAVTYPPQFEDISYGLTQPVAAGEAPRTGFLRTPTPGARNGSAADLLLTEQVSFSRAPGPFTGTITVTLTGASAGQRIRYLITPPSPAGMVTAEPGPSAAEYTGPLTISASSLVTAAVYDSTSLAHGFTASAHYVRLSNVGANRLDTFATDLPVLVIDTHGTGPLVKESGEREARLYSWNRTATGPTSLNAAPTLASVLRTNVRGASSADFPKKSYALQLKDGRGRDAPLPLYGLPAFDNWSLIGPWRYDRTGLNNAFVYALSNRLGRWAPRTQFVEVFFNADGGDLDAEDYVGVYVLTDALRVDSKRIDLTRLDPNDVGPNSITGGYVLKNDLADPDEFSFRTRRGFPAAPFSLVVSQPKAAALAPAQRDYVQGYLQAFDDAIYGDLASGWQQRTYLDSIDRASWVDHLLLNVLAMNVDGLTRSAYLTKDRGGRLTAGPVWDFDRALGGGDERSARPDVWNGPDGATEYWTYDWWGALALDPEFVQAWIDRWQTLRRDALATANLTGLVDTLAGQIGPAAAARDAARWPDNAPRFAGGWSGEVDHLKTWLTRRVTWIDGQFTAAPSVAASGSTVTFTPAPGAQLAYTTDGTDPRAYGGGLAGSALLSSNPVTVPATAALQARSYRAGYDARVVPSSPWSSAVCTPASAALSPAPRLANLSSRGFVGGGESVMITGVVVADTAGKTYLARAVGPGLTGFGVAGALAQPVLTILDAAGRTVARNSGWETGPEADDMADLAKGVGAFPLVRASRDAALVARLPYGQYTLQVSSANGGTGVSLAEIYELDPGVGRTLNLSTRGLVRAGEGLLIGGVVVRGPAPKRLLIRAVGPTLSVFGVTTALNDPVLTLFNGSQQVATNDDWSTRIGTSATAADVAEAAARAGAFALPVGSRDAALLLTLPEGAYTAQVTGKVAAEGVILLEIYEAP